MSWDHNGEVNGWVVGRYVQTQVDGGDAVYGWMVWQHYYDIDDNGVVDHFREVPAPVS